MPLSLAMPLASRAIESFRDWRARGFRHQIELTKLRMRFKSATTFSVRASWILLPATLVRRKALEVGPRKKVVAANGHRLVPERARCFPVTNKGSAVSS